MDSDGTVSNQPPRERVPVRRIHVLGAGAWGTTLATLLARNGYEVTLVARTERALGELRAPDAAAEGRIAFEHLDRHTLATTDLVLMAVPVQSMRAALTKVSGTLRGSVILSAAKGIEEVTLLRPSEIIREILDGDCQVAVVSGPNLSKEIAAGKPTSTVVASDDLALARSVANTLHSDRFRTYLSGDVTGVELGGALKNIIAIGAGIADGLEAGDNAKAALVTRGLAEIARLGVACGADPMTFAGLSGMGDLVATCASPLSRNHQVGVALAAGRSLAGIERTMTQTAEGIPTTRAAVDLAARRGIEMPIATQMHRVLFEGVSPAEAIARLMSREPGPEWRWPNRPADR